VSFELDLRRFVAKAGKQADLGVRKVCLDITAGVIQDTPVDTGRARANWQASIDAPEAGTLEAKDKQGSASAAKASASIAAAPGRVFYLVNNLPYAVPLEYGSSAQSPGGMVRVNLARVKASLG